jgi:hypothetical protein
MYRALVTIAGIYGTFPEGDIVAGVDEAILKSWLDDGIIEEVPEAAAEAVAVAGVPEPVLNAWPAAPFEPVTFEPVTFEPEVAPFYPEARPIEEVPEPRRAGKKSAPATKA